MIQLQNEKLIRLKDARKLAWLPGRDGGRLSLDSLRRWSLKGLRGVVLETLRIGGTTYTSIEALERFVERLSCGSSAPISVPVASRRREIAAADKRLDDAGI